jgi:hypothetical protein
VLHAYLSNILGFGGPNVQGSGRIGLLARALYHEIVVVFAAFALLSQDSSALREADRGWVTAGIAFAIREGWMSDHQDTLIGHVPTLSSRTFKDRWLLAGLTHNALAGQIAGSEEALRAGTTDLKWASLLRSRELLAFYRRSAKAFAPELNTLGLDERAALLRLEELGARLAKASPLRARPFRGVPSGQWAAKAVGDLRALGLLDGYPDGSFRG